MNYTIKNLDNCLSSFTEKKDVYQTVSPRKGFAPPRTAFSLGFRHLSAAAIAVEKPHFATVRPGFEYDDIDGVTLANVGSTNGIKSRNEGFPGVPASDIKWYYNPNQIFQDKIYDVIKSLNIK